MVTKTGAHEFCFLLIPAKAGVKMTTFDIKDPGKQEMIKIPRPLFSLGFLVLANVAWSQEASTVSHNQADQPDALVQNSTEPHEKSLDDIARELSNPNSPLANLTLKQTYTTFSGDLPGADDQSSSVTLFQPVFPFPIGDSGKTNLFVRPGIAYVEQQPVFNPVTARFENKSGLADIGFDVAIGQSYDGGVVVVGGLQGTIPTDTDVSAEQWRLGPEFALFKIGKTGYLGVFPSHQWDVSGGDSGYSTTQLELFAGYYLPKAWTIYTDSKWAYDWKADQATIPLNLSIRKVTKFGRMPVSVVLGVDYFVKSNDDFGQDWAIEFTIAPVVPNFIYNAFSH